MFKYSSTSFLIFSASSLPVLEVAGPFSCKSCLSVLQNFPVLCISKPFLSVSWSYKCRYLNIKILQTRKNNPKQIKFGTGYLCWWRERLASRESACGRQICGQTDKSAYIPQESTAQEVLAQQHMVSDRKKQIPTHQWLLKC